MIRLIVISICLLFSFVLKGSSEQAISDSLQILQSQLEIDSLKAASPKGNLPQIISLRKKLSKSYQNQKNYDAAITQQVFLYNNYYALDKSEEAEQSLEEGFELAGHFDADSSYAYTTLIANQGFYLRNIGLNGKSIEYMETAFSRLLNVHNETILSQRLFIKTMASIYQSRSDYFKAIDLLESFISNANEAGKTDTITKN